MNEPEGKKTTICRYLVNKLEASLTDDARVIIYDYIFLVRGTGCSFKTHHFIRNNKLECLSLISLSSLVSWNSLTYWADS